MRVLLVDDSSTARMFLRRIFTEIGGWEILEACDGKDALERLSDAGTVDLMCIDWNMPVMTGIEFLKAAKELPLFSESWKMMVTSETEMDNVSEAMIYGANEYLMKPFTKDSILAKLEIMGLN